MEHLLCAWHHSGHWDRAVNRAGECLTQEADLPVDTCDQCLGGGVADGELTLGVRAPSSSRCTCDLEEPESTRCVADRSSSSGRDQFHCLWGPIRGQGFPFAPVLPLMLACAPQVTGVSLNFS